MFSLRGRQALLALILLNHIGCSNYQVSNLTSQGSPEDSTNTSTPREVVTNFFSPLNGETIDILFIIDNSASMSTEQQIISERLGAFVDRISHLDWRIAITSTDMTSSTTSSNPTSGRLVSMTETQKYLDRNTANHSEIFREMVHLGEHGAGQEQGIRSALRAFERNETGWIRPEAQLAVVVLSDEDECSGQNLNCMTQENDHTYLLQRVREIYGPQKILTFNSIVVKDEACKELQSTQINISGDRMLAHIGRAYLAATEATGGVSASICSVDYTSELLNVGQRLEVQSNSRVLECEPVDNAVTAILQDNQIVSTQVNGSQISYSSIPPGSTLSVSYTCRE